MNVNWRWEWRGLASHFFEAPKLQDAMVEPETIDFTAKPA